MPNNKKCAGVASAAYADANTRGESSGQLEIRPVKGTTFPAYTLTDPSSGLPAQLDQKTWSRHYVNFDPRNPGEIVDHDQGFVWNNKQEMVNAMYDRPVVLEPFP